MPDVAENLRSWLLADATIAAEVGSEVHQDACPEEFDGAYIWYGRSGTEDEDSLDDEPGAQPFRELFDVELISDDLDQVQQLAQLVRSKNKYRGAFGAGTVQAVFVRDHSDDYVFRGLNLNADEGEHVAALQLEIIGHEE